LIAKAFIDPGDIIITEGPTYLGALQAFSAYEPDVRAIPFDADGIRIDLLEAELERIGHNNPRLKFCYVIPNFQNPGGVTMSPERRERLVELSHEYGFMLVEDDPYGRLRYDGGHRIPLKALDDDVVYLGTISKTFAPGFRVGWVVAKEHVLAKLNLVKQGTDLCSSTFDQIVVEHYYKDTDWQRTLQKFVKTYRTRRDAMLAALEEFFPPEATWTHPEGGFFVWVTLPDYVDTASMLPEALEAGVTYVPGDSFFPDGQTGKNSMRINFSFASPENIREGIRRLAEVIEERLELYRVFIEAGAI
jgi:2-aminoadipate transaminase